MAFSLSPRACGSRIIFPPLGVPGGNQTANCAYNAVATFSLGSQSATFMHVLEPPTVKEPDVLGLNSPGVLSRQFAGS